MNQSSTVELIVEAAKAINPLRRVERQSKKVEQALKKTQKSARDVEAAFQRMGRNGIRGLRDLEANTAKLGRSLGGLRGNVAKATLGFAAFKSVQVGIQRLDSERRLRLLTQRFGETAQAQEIANRAAEKFNLSQTEANTQLSRLIARLRPMGLSMKTIETAFAGFNTATILAGATASESAGAFLQLSQALGSGVLRGQELNSILEQAPLIAQAIATEMGSTVGALKKFGEEGQITSEIVIAALGRVEREGADQLAEALGGPSAKIKDFQNAVQDAQVAITESSIPAITDSIKDLGIVIRQLEPAIKFIGELLAGVAKTVGNVVENVASGGKTTQARLAAERAATLQARNKFGPLAREGITPGFKEFRDEVLQRELSRRLAIARGAVPGQLPPSAAMGGTQDLPRQFSPQPGPNGGRKGRERVDISQKLLDLNRELLDSDTQLTELQKINLEFQIEKQKILEGGFKPREQEVKLLEAARGFEEDLLGYREDQLRIQEKANDLAERERKKREAEEKRRREADPGFQMQQQLEELLKLENQVAAGATAIGNAFSNSFKAVITGSKSAQEALADMMSAVAEHFMDMAAKIIAQQIAMIIYGTVMKALGIGGGGFTMSSGATGNFTQVDSNVLGSLGGIPTGYNQGGYASSPTRALVGEGGESEYIIPESKMRESMARYSRGARGASVIPETGGSGTSGEGGGTAVAAPIDVRYTVERINSVDYVTADQFQAGMRQAANQGAKQGEQQTLKRLQMSGGTRRRLGM